ncbi:GIY-YIG nuclease family protein [Geomonas nitrogeniifigens]|uniref:GIY-YIG nuclease family protein n=1 Tax=Geomonas diazotrophica TaxID=2843197 RepID=A0ABX8JPV7_9BACT|nr:GIY-YIG nuclease family protein [Geomonas nitrogeniifigens]QWV98652.1 GIY-YIG nuclease family protein [Geomonas nitrogeniifigens]QXE87815.1 GIY-YIG nuclease family protein [Geomonas nitrogeniifigens]
MKYVYYLQSIPHPDQHYIGLTTDVNARLSSHNAGQSPHTSQYRPWKIITYHAFADEAKAAAFEKYLKSCSGLAFRKKHF